MVNGLVGSDLTRYMLASKVEKVWCAISDDSDEQAMMNLDGNDFTANIVSHHEGYFYCEAGRSWLCAVPIKIVALEPEATEYLTSTVQLIM